MVSSTCERREEVPLEIAQKLSRLALELHEFCKDELVQKSKEDETMVSNFLKDESFIGNLKLLPSGRWRITDYGD